MPSKKRSKANRADVGDLTDAIAKAKLSHRTCTGVLASKKISRDVKISSFSLSYHGKVLIAETDLELTYGRRYGLIGMNGSGKSTLLECLVEREVPIPDHIDIFLLREEAEPSERTALEVVIDQSTSEVQRLEAEEIRIMEEEGPESENLQLIYERLDRLDASKFETNAAELLFGGLGFSKEQMAKQTKDLSGGWRMRVALAKALSVAPMLLLMDEPTNHLDLESCVWLEERLKNYPHTLVMISHSQDFLNGVCTNIINLRLQLLIYYGGNYDTFVKTKRELEIDQMKRYNKQQEEIAHMKSFIASCGTYANLVRQGKSRQKVLDKMEAAGLVEKVIEDKTFVFAFPDCGPLPPPVVHVDGVSFSYSGQKKDFLYSNLDLSIDLDSRVALVGPNGAGKSTLLKLIAGDISPTAGQIKKNGHLRIGRYHQHSVDQLDLSLSPLHFFRKIYEHLNFEEEQWRAIIGRYGISGFAQTTAMGLLSDGQKSRAVFAMVALSNPHMLLLDEPTNHLDMECIDSLADAINHFDGGLLLVSHDFRLIKQVAKEIWVCDNHTVKPFRGDIKQYKTELQSAMVKRRQNPSA